MKKCPFLCYCCFFVALSTVCVWQELMDLCVFSFSLSFILNFKKPRRSFTIYYCSHFISQLMPFDVSLEEACIKNNSLHEALDSCTNRVQKKQFDHYLYGWKFSPSLFVMKVNTGKHNFCFMTHDLKGVLKFIGVKVVSAISVELKCETRYSCCC